MLDGVRCTTLNGHVNGLLHKVCKEDKLNGYGSRCAAGGDIGLLTGFDLNKKLSLNTVLPVQPVHSLDSTTGNMKVQISSFIAYKRKGYPQEATHFRMVSGGVLVNFSDDGYSNNIQTSELLPLSRKTPGDICLEHRLNGKPGDVMVQVLGILLYKLVNGKEVLVKGGAVRILEARMAETRIEDELHEVLEARILETRIDGELHEIVEEEDLKGSEALSQKGHEGKERQQGIKVLSLPIVHQAARRGGRNRWARWSLDKSKHRFRLFSCSW